MYIYTTLFYSLNLTKNWIVSENKKKYKNTDFTYLILEETLKGGHFTEKFFSDFDIARRDEHEYGSIIREFSMEITSYIKNILTSVWKSSPHKNDYIDAIHEHIYTIFAEKYSDRLTPHNLPLYIDRINSILEKYY